MKKNIITILVLLLTAITASAKDIRTKIGAWEIIYNSTYHTFSYLKDGKTVIPASRPESVYNEENGIEHKVNSADFRNAKAKTSPNGKLITLSENLNNNGLTMSVEFMLWGENIETRLLLNSSSQMASNYLAPINTVGKWEIEGSELRMLKVPFDNDGFSRYEYNPLTTSMTSYEVTAVFDGVTRKGTVIGSVEHTHWKSAIDIKGENKKNISNLKVYSGVSTKETHDLLPHGKLIGKEIASAWTLIAPVNDWREGMELFAKACTDRQPGRNTWKGGIPIGWQSWGVMSSHNSFDIDIAVADFYAKNLRSMGFAGDNGMQIMSIDAWDNLSPKNKKALTEHCEEQGQIAGLYRSPFSLWWGDEESLKNPLFNGCEYKAYDCVLKANGKPFKYDGAYCLDPTHPATKEMMRRDMEEARNQGFRYVKVDFVTNGILQADSYYNNNVHTAVEAYNEGFSCFADQCYDDKGEPMFIALSISPIFPYQYGNSRRIACDTWGKIDQSEYAMNAICGGWWANGLFQRNDPDHIVLVGNDAKKETEGENRARLTTGIASGMILLADNYDINDTITKCGDPKLSIERANKLLSNKKINTLIGKIKHSFHPVYGYKPYDGKASSADNFVRYEDDEAVYVAVVNYSNNSLSGQFKNEELGLKNDLSLNVEELWTEKSQHGLSYDVPANDARIYKIKK